MDLREALLQARNQIEKILKGQIGMKPADDVKLRDGLAISRSRGFERLFQGHGVSARSVFLFPEGAKPASRHANIGGIEMTVDVEVSPVTVHALTDGIRHPADGENVAGAIESEGIVVA